MEAGLQSGGVSRPTRAFGPGLVVAAAALLVWRAWPLCAAYLDKLRGEHPAAIIGAAAAAAVTLWALLAAGIRRRPAGVAAGLSLFAAATLVLSGNLLPAAVAGLLLAATLGAGDLVVRALRGADAGPGDLSSTFAAGYVAIGLVVLALAETGTLTAGALAAVLVAASAARPRRISRLARLCARAARVPRGSAPRGLEAAWLAFVVLVLVAAWAGALCPDISWDGLAYHLPEARAVAMTGRVAAAADLAPQSYLWRAHENYLALGFFFGGERVARFLQFSVGLVAFGATLALARRIGRGGAGPLAAFLLAALPTAMLQLRATYADWPAAVLVAAAAAELAAARIDAGRLRLAAFLFGGAIGTKVFAVLAAPALAVLGWRAGARGRAFAATAVCALLALAPWLVWSRRHTGSIATPYAPAAAELPARLMRGDLFRRSPASGVAAAPERWPERVARFARLPFDLVFHSSRFEANGDGYNGVVALAAAVGLAGWSARRVALFAAVALPALVPWSLLYFPSVRFLFPLFPLYAVFVAEGLDRLTRDFSQPGGRAAGAGLLVAAVILPVQAGSSGLEARVAVGLLSREGFLEERLPAYRLEDLLTSGDRVVLVGENDRFHCSAAEAWRDDFAPVAAWGADPSAWRRGMEALGITAVLVREDRRPGVAARLASLGGALEPVARHGPAVLFRVRR